MEFVDCLLDLQQGLLIKGKVNCFIEHFSQHQKSEALPQIESNTINEVDGVESKTKTRFIFP